MADHGATHDHAPATTGGDDFPAHVETYESFLHATKWGVIGLIILLVLMTFFLV